MTHEFENMLYLFGAAATGKEIDVSRSENLGRIRELAVSQEIWDVIYATLRAKIEDGSIAVPPEIYMRLEKTFLSNVALNIRKTEFNLATIKKLEENGIKCCILKGITVSRFYAMPETRISSDMDILISEKDEKKATGILKTLEYFCEERAKYDHHMKAHHKIGGLLEVHVALHSVPTNDIILDDEIRYEEEFITLEDGITSLSVNDGLIYLSAHLIKHLVHDATGVRQMMDLLLYMKAYEKDIDWEKYNSLMKKLGYETLINVVKGIGVRFFGLEFEDAITEGSGFEELLDDCETGGVFGYAERERRAFYDMFTKKRSGKGTLGFLIYRLFTAEVSLISLIFPPASAIKMRFNYVRKYPVLLPVGWVHRFIDIFVRNSDKGKADISEEERKTGIVLKRRMDMAEKLGMFKTE